MTEETIANIKHLLIETAYRVVRDAGIASPKEAREIPAYQSCLLIWCQLQLEGGNKKPDTLWYFVNGKFEMNKEEVK